MNQNNISISTVQINVFKLVVQQPLYKVSHYIDISKDTCESKALLQQTESLKCDLCK